MMLEDYRVLCRLDKQDAAHQLQVDPATYGRWEAGQTMPRPEQIENISVWSKGAVTANDIHQKFMETRK